MGASVCLRVHVCVRACVCPGLRDFTCVHVQACRCIRVYTHMCICVCGASLYVHYACLYLFILCMFIFVYILGFPHISVSKESAGSAGDPGSILGSGRSPGEGNGNPLQYLCLENLTLQFSPYPTAMFGNGAYKELGSLRSQDGTLI